MAVGKWHSFDVDLLYKQQQNKTNEPKRLRIPTDRRWTRWLRRSTAEELSLRLRIRNISSCWSEWYLKSGSPDFKSSTLPLQPRCLLCNIISCQHKNAVRLDREVHFEYNRFVWIHPSQSQKCPSKSLLEFRQKQIFEDTRQILHNYFTKISILDDVYYHVGS